MTLMSEYAVEIERLTVRLENLSTNYFVRLKKELNEADKMSQASLKVIGCHLKHMKENFNMLIKIQFLLKNN